MPGCDLIFSAPFSVACYSVVSFVVFICYSSLVILLCSSVGYYSSFCYPLLYSFSVYSGLMFNSSVVCLDLSIRWLVFDSLMVWTLLYTRYQKVCGHKCWSVFFTWLPCYILWFVLFYGHKSAATIDLALLFEWNTYWYAILICGHKSTTIELALLFGLLVLIPVFINVSAIVIVIDLAVFLCC